jgi:hypothetical protein
MTFSTIKIFTAVLLVTLILFLQSCVNKTNENQPDKINLQDIDLARQEIIKVNGITISPDLFISWSNGQQRKEQLANLIEKSLKKDKPALIELTEFDCGGGAGCYDLGSIIVQIIYRIGEENAVNTFQNYNSDKACRTEHLIAAGLEYGDNNYDDKMDNKLIEKEFPKLHKLFTEKKPCN